MKALTPIEAARLAEAVYGIRETDQVERGVLDRGGRALFDAVRNDWDLAGGTVVSGKSGLVSSETSGFGLVLKGRTGGRRAGEWAVVARGTQTLADWASNFNFPATSGPAGLPVHRGFLGIFETMSKAVARALPGGGTVHLVGHSLGGALASLMAAQLGAGDAYALGLYSFGAPRVGQQAFGSFLEQRLGTPHIYRVYDVADPVPLVPLFPFLHCPLTSEGYRVGQSAALIHPDKHSMTKNYIPLVAQHEWTALAAPAEPIRSFRDVDELLDIAGLHARIPGGALGLWTLGKVFQALIDVAAMLTGGVLFLAETVLDKVAKLLLNVARVSKEIGERILDFMKLLFQWAGRKVHTAVELTSEFLGYAMELLLRPIAALVDRAIQGFGS